MKSDPAVDIVTGFVGGRVNIANLNITLKPLSERKVSADQVINRLRPKLARVPGATLFLQAVQDVQIGGRGATRSSNTRCRATTCRTCWPTRPVLEKLRALPELRDVNSDLQNRGLQAGLVIDRDTASRLGITANAIDNALYDAFGQRQVSTMYEGINQYHVVMEIDPKFQQSPDALSNLYVPSTTGEAVPLSAFTHYAALDHRACRSLTRASFPR